MHRLQTSEYTIWTLLYYLNLLTFISVKSAQNIPQVSQEFWPKEKREKKKNWDLILKRHLAEIKINFDQTNSYLLIILLASFLLQAWGEKKTQERKVQLSPWIHLVWVKSQNLNRLNLPCGVWQALCGKIFGRKGLGFHLQAAL